MVGSQNELIHFVLLANNGANSKCRVQQDSPDSQQTLVVDSRAHAVHAFVNGVYAG